MKLQLLTLITIVTTVTALRRPRLPDTYEKRADVVIECAPGQVQCGFLAVDGVLVRGSCQNVSLLYR